MCCDGLAGQLIEALIDEKKWLVFIVESHTAARPTLLSRQHGAGAQDALPLAPLDPVALDLPLARLPLRRNSAGNSPVTVGGSFPCVIVDANGIVRSFMALSLLSGTSSPNSVITFGRSAHHKTTELHQGGALVRQFTAVLTVALQCVQQLQGRDVNGRAGRFAPRRRARLRRPRPAGARAPRRATRTVVVGVAGVAQLVRLHD